MKLTPLDIRKQEFKKTMRGFDPEEVEAFLSMVADELELLIREKNQTNDELIKLRTQLKDYQRVEHTLRETLVKAQNTVDESRANSRREAEIIMHEAELQAEAILKEAREELMKLRHEISMVKTQKESFSNRLKHLLQSQIELLEVMAIENKRADEEPRREQQFRGRLPRRDDSANVEKASEVKQPGGQAPAQHDKDEPRIIRDKDPMESPASHDMSEGYQQESRKKDKESGHISDQFIV